MIDRDLEDGAGFLGKVADTGFILLDASRAFELKTRFIQVARKNHYPYGSTDITLRGLFSTVHPQLAWARQGLSHPALVYLPTRLVAKAATIAGAALIMGACAGAYLMASGSETP